ncbi:peptidoglycan bridge formation glycyltransferase FemA/FemB family protein [bacterium]|nr:peptidoglycan bridge formation glycyltransferase FemA/FemB family protein [bacterium]
MIATLEQWNEFVASHPNAHILQSGPWGELKSAFGWKAVRVINEECGAQVLFRKLPGGFTIGYIPKGPIGQGCGLFTELDEVCRENRAIFLKVEPDIWEPEQALSIVEQPGWVKTKTVQPRRTVVISLNGSEEEILDRMKQKTRYNIRLAEKKGIEVRTTEDIQAFYEMSEVTGKRDGFGVHSLNYYQKALELFKPSGHADLLVAYYDNRPIAGLIVFALGDMAWYMYGASSDEERNRMPTYLLQWEAMKWARKMNCKYYDLWGIPDVDEEVLEEEFSKKHSHEGLWGVYRFKRGFGGEVFRSVGAWDRTYLPGIYKIYRQIMRLRGGEETG